MLVILGSFNAASSVVVLPAPKASPLLLWPVETYATRSARAWYGHIQMMISGVSVRSVRSSRSMAPKDKEYHHYPSRISSIINLHCSKVLYEASGFKAHDHPGFSYAAVPKQRRC
jgi:hypothetical protein